MAESNLQIGRIAYVDRLRGLAVFTMFAVHSPHPWLEKSALQGSYGSFLSSLSGMVAPVFMGLAGMAMALVVDHANARGKNVADVQRKLIVRGLSIVGVGYGLEAVFWALGGFYGDWLRIFKVNILQCIGVGIMVCSWLCLPRRRMNWPAVVTWSVMVLGAQVTWRLVPPNWLPSQIWGYIAWVPGISRFPIFPYVGWIALGLVVGPLWLSSIKAPGKGHGFWMGLIVAGAGAWLLSFALKWLTYRYGVDMIGVPKGESPPITTVHTFFYKSSMLFFLLVAARYTDSLFGRIPFNQYGLLVLFGRTSLFAYCMHLVLIYYVFGRFLNKSLGVWGHIIAVAALTGVMAGACYVWQQLPSGNRWFSWLKPRTNEMVR